MTDPDVISPVAAAGLDPARLGGLAADGLPAMDDGELFLDAREEEELT
jgi:hypothetical protein